MSRDEVNEEPADDEEEVPPGVTVLPVGIYDSRGYSPSPAPSGFHRYSEEPPF